MQGVAAVAGGSKGAPLMREYKGRIQLVDLAAYGAPAGCTGFHYPDLFFGPAAPSNPEVSRGGSAPLAVTTG